jgi:hypothetical protein
MVLDASAMSWAKATDIDTKKLKAAKVPIYGKWYFPELPTNVPLVNLETGQRRVFDAPMLAGEVMWVRVDDLRRLGVELPPEPTVESAEPSTSTELAPSRPPEPLLALVRPPEPLAEAVQPPSGNDLASHQGVPHAPPASALGIHMPMASIGPFVLGIGLCLAFLGLITTPLILVVGLVWALAGAIVWVRIGMLEHEQLHPGEQP